MTADPANTPDAPLDGTTLPKLLADLSPSQAGRLHAELINDLRKVRDELRRGLTGAAKFSPRPPLHVLKSLSGTIGAEPLYRRCLALLQSVEAAPDDGLWPEIADLLPLVDSVIAAIGRLPLPGEG